MPNTKPKTKQGRKERRKNDKLKEIEDQNPTENKNISKVKPEETHDTVFIRNLSFETEDDNLKEFFEKGFGETVYCLVCRDRETDESKGTAFVRFKDPENAAKCLKEARDKELMTKFHLDGRNLIVLPAVSREKVGELRKNDGDKKDKRNLVLAKEGFIHPNSDEATELSKGDLEKRKILDNRKRELLKNLHNFVSDTRLCFHNLPPYVDDKRLRQICIQAIRTDHPAAKIVECRVMRNKKGRGELGTSKGFGFVAYSKHEHALAALRNLNNNPKIFTPDKRPIVEFSVENMVALNKKKTRLVNSQRKNEAIRSGTSIVAKPDGSKQPDIKKSKNDKAKSKYDAKKMKKKSSVTVNKIDDGEEANLLKKIHKLKKAKLAS